MKWILLLVGLGACAAPSKYIQHTCKNGKAVRVLKPEIKNAALQRLVLDNRTREACDD